jgi:hypothetical protein
MMYEIRNTRSERGDDDEDEERRGIEEVEVVYRENTSDFLLSGLFQYTFWSMF